MSSPIKFKGTLSEMKQADARLLIYASLCHEGKIDMQKLADHLGMKKSSVHTNYYRAKGRLQALIAEESSTTATTSNAEAEDTSKSDVTNTEDTEAGAPAKKARSGKRAAASKKDVPAKRRQAAPKATAQAE
ncbi:hypothetical protein PENCOP_c002G07472 [Penicillium coprophilum]|uniref:Uncharacterized protein n=1 Tax=Penicillium coprophilum TaxID=36646 RepID=A0A1V6V2H6_9EURO|nr:hypothetical protein PENCOP_c002G07472 [Penicillium coprophilum]